MTNDYQYEHKLELLWPGKERSTRPEPRILIEKKRYNGSKNGLHDNLLIHGDNLLGLKAIESQYADKIKCIYIDPPYNTKSIFKQYDDSMEHSMWLDMMKERLIILQRLLRPDGTIWISIDDDECHYLKVLCDEIFGRKNFVANVIWQKKNSVYQKANKIADVHDHILVYAKDAQIWRPYRLPRPEEMNANYKNPDNDPRGPWMSDNLTVGMTREQRPNQYYGIVDPSSGNEFWPSPRRVWSYIPNTMTTLMRENRILFPKDPKNRPSLKRFLHELQEGILPTTFWSMDSCGTNSEAKKEASQFNNDDLFATPKPERLMQQIMQIATIPGDLVLDCFAGSGTTGAVAHKMGRRWIMIEMGDHAKTHIIPRLEKVIAGDDLGGITNSVNWNGGGSFRFCAIAPSLLQQDELGRMRINKSYTPQMLKEAMCLHAGFALMGHSNSWWCHGQSGEGSYVYVTPETLTRPQLARLSEEVGPNRSCLVFCGAFTCTTNEFDNLTIQKIPKTILSKCDWDRQDYSLKNKRESPRNNISYTTKQIRVRNSVAAKQVRKK